MVMTENEVLVSKFVKNRTMKKILFYCIILSFILISCKTKEVSKIPVTVKIRNSMNADQQTIIYKTSGDFSNLIPVTMNTEKTKIVSYPAVSDIFYNGKLARPTALKNNYWLDNRGINEHVVFLSYTYEEYSRLKETPTMSEMMLRIVEKYPLVEYIYCGSRYQYKDEVKDLNALIDAGFPNCKKAVVIPMQINF
jgi:hypothetical protein